MLTNLQAVSPGKPSIVRSTLPVFLPQAAPGQVMSARVDAVLPDGAFRVVVAGQEMSMALPQYFSPGDTLDLVFLGREPRLTFALAAPAAAPSSPAAVVSDAGRVVASVLPRQGEAAMAVAAADAPPLIAGAPDEPAVLSDKLQRIITESGLFYESHQAEWLAGKREIATLLREPQAGIETKPLLLQAAVRQAGPAEQASAQALISNQPLYGPQGSVEQNGRTTRIAGPVLRQPGHVELPPAPVDAQGSVARTAGSADSAISTGSARTETSMAQQTQALVQQQLAALETGKMIFQLQVWPDQWMRWEIDEEPQQNGHPTSGEAPAHQTRLHLDLPNLGALDATLSFGSAGVRVRLDAAKPSSADLMQDHRASLRAALADAGLTTVDVAVVRHGQN